MKAIEQGECVRHQVKAAIHDDDGPLCRSCQQHEARGDLRAALGGRLLGVRGQRHAGRGGGGRVRERGNLLHPDHPGPTIKLASSSQKGA